MIALERDYNIKLSSKIVDYIYPDYVFIPLYDNYKLQIKHNELVKKEQVLLLGEDGASIYSPVSGKVVGAKECLLSTGVLQKCLVIENDFKEKLLNRVAMRKNLKQVSKNDFLEVLRNKGVISENKTLLAEKFENKNFNKIVLNGVVDEPYIASMNFYMNTYTTEILETMSFLAKIFELDENIIVLKNNDRDNLEKFTNIIGTYPEITFNVVPDLYPIGNKEILMKYMEYTKDTTLIINPVEALTIYNLMKKNKLSSEKLITITGNAIENPIVVNAKIGSLVKNIIDEYIKFLSNDEVNYIVNGLMTGKCFDIKDLIVTSDLEGIIINYDKKNKIETECINCGKCSQICPVKLDPNLIYNKKNKIENIEECINCGLCTYICPSYINFKAKIEELKNEK